MAFKHPYYFLFLAALIWGGHAVVGKLATAEISPMILSLVRWTVAVIILLPFSIPALKKDWKLIRKHYLLLFSYGMLACGLFNIFNYLAFSHTTALNVALIQASEPALILLLSVIVFRQRLVFSQILGLVLALLGVLLIVTNWRLQTLTTLSFNAGDMLMIFASSAYAIYSVLLCYKPDISWLSFMTLLAVAGWVTVLPMAVYEMMTQTVIIHFSLKSIALVLYVSLLASVAAQLSYAKGISMIGASRGGLAINLIPVIGALMAVVFLGEAFHWYHLVGLVFVLSGIALSERFIKGH